METEKSSNFTFSSLVPQQNPIRLMNKLEVKRSMETFLSKEVAEKALT